jgi:hypothetical protein
MEMNAMCQLLSNALRAGDAFDLLVLKELLEVLTGIAAHSDVSEKQVSSCALVVTCRQVGECQLLLPTMIQHMQACLLF